MSGARKRKLRKGLRRTLICMVLIGFCFCGYRLAGYFMGLQHDADSFEELSRIAAGTSAAPVTTEATAAPEKTVAATSAPAATEAPKNAPVATESPVPEESPAPVPDATDAPTGVPEPTSAPTQTTASAAPTETPEPTETPTAAPVIPLPTERVMLENYAPLYEMNPRIFGWLRIENTLIDYPIMHTPEDPQYYLHRNFEGKYSYSGVPFMEESCFEGCGNYLIHGHHMKDGSMFGTLDYYADEEYWMEHPMICFDTMYERGEYEIVAAFYGKVYKDDREGFRYYEYTNLTQREVFEEYIEQITAAALYDTGVEAAFGDELITLSTCEYHTSNGRFVVVARKIVQEDEP